jgi:hypothetical protein
VLKLKWRHPSLGASTYYRAPLCIYPGNKFIFADAWELQNQSVKGEHMKLIEVVKDSLDANGIKYTVRPIVMPANTLIAQPVIGGDQLDCFVICNEKDEVIVVEYPYSGTMDQIVLDEVATFAIGLNEILSLGLLSIDSDMNVVFKDGLKLDYVANPQQSISAFILKIGVFAKAALPYLHSIVIGKSTAADELEILIQKSNDPFLSNGII